MTRIRTRNPFSFRPSRDYLAVSAPISGRSAFEVAATFGDDRTAGGMALYSLSDSVPDCHRGGGEGPFLLFRRDLLAEDFTALVDAKESLERYLSADSGGEAYAEARRLYRWIRSRMMDAKTLPPLLAAHDGAVESLAVSLLFCGLSEEDQAIGVLDPIDFGADRLRKLGLAITHFLQSSAYPGESVSQSLKGLDIPLEEAASDMAHAYLRTGCGFCDRHLNGFEDDLKEEARSAFRMAGIYGESVYRCPVTGRVDFG
jgi:hypothetical protein